MALMYVPRQTSPFQQMLPGFLQNMMFNQMATKRQDAQTQAQVQREQAQVQREQAKELRGYQAAGWREPEAQQPVIEVGGTGLVPPQTGYEVRTQNGRQVLVQTKTPYGETPQVQKASVMKSDKQYKPGTVEVFDPQTGRTAIHPTYVSGGKLVRGKEAIGEKRPSGLKFTQTPEGGIQLIMGGGMQGGMGELTKGTKTQTQKSIKSLEGRKQLLESMMQKWRPEYNTWLTKGTMYMRSLQESAHGIPGVKPLDPAKKKELEKFTSFRTDSAEDFARLVHDLAGGTLTRHEAKTYGAFIQNASKDSPTEYTTKLKQNYIQVNKQLARENYYLNVLGMKPSVYKKMLKNNEVNVASFDKIIDQKYAEFTTKLRQEKPDVPWEQIKAEAKGMIKASFFGF